MTIEEIKNINNQNFEYMNEQFSEVLKIDSVIDSKIKVPINIDILEISNIENSKLLIGPVKTSVVIRKCKNCIIGIVCKQIRIHDSQQLKIWLSCCTPPLIENCKSIVFDIKKKDNSNYYDSYEDHLNNIQIKKSEFLEKEKFIVHDLDWLRLQPSPNWNIGTIDINQIF